MQHAIAITRIYKCAITRHLTRTLRDKAAQRRLAHTLDLALAPALHSLGLRRHALLCAAGYHIKWLLRMIVKKGLAWK